MFKAIAFALKYYPIIAIVIGVVEAFMSDRSGEEKKAVVLRAITQIAEKLGVVLSESVVSLISNIIDAIVSALNVMGIFTHKEKEKAEALVVTPTGKVVAPVTSLSPVDVELEDKLKEIEKLLIR